MPTDTRLQSELMEEFRTTTPGADDLQKSYALEDMASSNPLRAAGSADSQAHATRHSGSASPEVPSHEDIARRAYDIYVKKGRPQGQCRQNWREAEQELNMGDHASCVAHQCGKTPQLPHVG